jgi:hypothetical protein
VSAEFRKHPNENEMKRKKQKRSENFKTNKDKVKFWDNQIKKLRSVFQFLKSIPSEVKGTEKKCLVHFASKRSKVKKRLFRFA